MVHDEFTFYDANQEKIIQGHVDEFVVVKDRHVCGYYKSEEDAFDSMIGNELGTFLVKRLRSSPPMLTLALCYALLLKKLLTLLLRCFSEFPNK
jgi:hypothetical protein